MPGVKNRLATWTRRAAASGGRVGTAASHAAIHGVFLILSVVFCSRFFLLSDLDSHAIVEGDPALMNWTLQWVSRALYTEPLNLFNGNTFHPYPNSVALTDHMLSLALINIPFQMLSGSTWLGYNFLIFLAYYLSCVGGYWLGREVTGSRHAGVWAGIFWAFMFFRVHHIGHLQILSYQWMPFIVVALVRLLRSPTPGRTLAFSLFFVLQALVSWYLAVISTVLVSVVALSHFKPTYLTLTRGRYYAPALVLCAATILPFAAPYTLSFENTYLGDRYAQSATIGDSVSLSDYLIPPAATFLGQLLENSPWIWEENTLFVGYVPLALALTGLIASVARYRTASVAFARLNRVPWTPATARWVTAGVSLVLIGFVLAKGFVSHAWEIKLPLFYLAEVPGLGFIRGMRAPQRFSLLIYFGITLLSGIGAAVLVAQAKKLASKIALTAVFSLVFLAEVYPYQLPISPQPYEVSQLDRAIASYRLRTPGTPVVLHLPIFYFLMDYAPPEAAYMLDSTIHWSRVVNGFSGANPRGFMENMEAFDSLPSQRGVTKLTELEVDLVAMHQALPGNKRRELIAHFSDVPWATVVTVGNDEHLVLIDWKRIPPQLTESLPSPGTS